MYNVTVENVHVRHLCILLCFPPLYSHLTDTVANRLQAVQEVFPSEPLRVFANLMQRLFSQRGHPVTEGVLDNVKLTGGDEALLPCLCELYNVCWAWCSRFEELVGGDVEIRYMVNEIFNKHLPEYPARESKVLVSKCEVLLPLPPHELQELLHWSSSTPPAASINIDIGPIEECCRCCCLV
jgi:hypothetical protein